jgi:hypothetical protein
MDILNEGIRPPAGNESRPPAPETAGPFPVRNAFLLQNFKKESGRQTQLTQNTMHVVVDEMA